MLTAPIRFAILLCALMSVGTAASALETPPAFLFNITGTGRVAQMTETADGRIFAPSMDYQRIFVFAESGAYLASFGYGGSDLGLFNLPTGVAIDHAGNIYVCDQNNNRVQKFSPFYVPIMAIGTLGSGPGQLHYPTNCVVSPDDSKLYVTEIGNNRVSIFGTDGTFIGSFGSLGSAPGQFNYPFGIVIEPHSGDLFIANENNNRIDRFTSAGTFISSFGQAGSGLNDFGLAVGLGMDAAGNLWATDQLNNRIKKLTQSGTVLAMWGMFGGGANQFYNPWSVMVTSTGNVWVGDTYNYRIEVFGDGAVPVAKRTWGALKAEYR